MRLDRYSLTAALAAVLLLLPQVASAQHTLIGPTGRLADNAEGTISFMRGGDIVITQNLDSETVNIGGVRCGNADAGYTTENSFYRVFDLSEYAEITGDFTVSEVEFGIFVNNWPVSEPTQTGSLRIYTLANPPVDGTFAAADLSLVAEQEFELTGFPGPDAQGYLENVMVEGTFSNTDLLAVEMFLPSGDPAETGLEEPINVNQGGNSVGVTANEYLASASCGIVDPVDVAFIGAGFPSNWVVNVTGTVGGTDVEDGVVAQRVTLGQSYPNPAVGQTAIPFSLDEAAQVRVTLYDVLGREVAVVTDAPFAAGEQSVTFDASRLPSGTYFYHVSVEGQTMTQRMVVLQ